jgi:hypothetical protein
MTWHITLNLEVEAKDETEAIEIASDAEKLLLSKAFQWKLNNVESDDIEEN